MLDSEQSPPFLGRLPHLGLGKAKTQVLVPRGPAADIYRMFFEAALLHASRGVGTAVRYNSGGVQEEVKLWLQRLCVDRRPRGSCLMPPSLYVLFLHSSTNCLPELDLDVGSKG